MGTFIVSCIDRVDSSDTRSCIRGLGGLSAETGRRWRMTGEEAIAVIEDGIHGFVVVIGGRNAEVIVVDHPAGYSCLKTSLDSDRENSLLLRPQCPVS